MAVLSYRYWRFHPTAYRVADPDVVQISEFELRLNNARVSGPPTVTHYVISGIEEGSPVGEEPANAYDNNVATKWVALNANSGLQFDFGAPVSADSYRWATATDVIERDPLSWRVEGSTNGSTWVVLDTRTNYATPTARSTYLPTFAFPDPPTNSTASFFEPFTGTTLGAGWTYAFGSGGVAISGGQATFTTSTTYANIIRTETYDLTGSYMVWNISSVGQQVGNDLTVGLSRTTADNGAGLGWTVAHTSTTQIYAVARYRATDNVTHSVQLESNLPIATKWFRVREAGGTWFWDHSTDGISWTNYTSRAAPVATTAVRPYVLWGRWDTAAGRVNTSYVLPGINELPGSSGALTAGASASVGIAPAPIPRTFALTSTAAASMPVTGRAEYRRDLTATASAALTVSGVVRRDATLTATALASGSWVGGQSGVVAPTVTASFAIGTTRLTKSGSLSSVAAGAATLVGQNVWFRAISARSATSASVSSVVVRSGLLTANGRASPAVGLVVFVLALKARPSIAVTGRATIAPLKRRISTVQVVADITGEPRSVTGMTALASIAVDGDTSVVTLGPASRFDVRVNASGRFSVITELEEAMSVQIGTRVNLRVVQSLTTIFEEGIPALVVSPVPVIIPAADPEPEPESTPVPVFGRVFYGLRR